MSDIKPNAGCPFPVDRIVSESRSISAATPETSPAPASPAQEDGWTNFLDNLGVKAAVQTESTELLDAAKDLTIGVLYGNPFCVPSQEHWEYIVRDAERLRRAIEKAGKQ